MQNRTDVKCVLPMWKTVHCAEWGKGCVIRAKFRGMQWVEAVYEGKMTSFVVRAVEIKERLRLTLNFDITFTSPFAIAVLLCYFVVLLLYYSIQFNSIRCNCL